MVNCADNTRAKNLYIISVNRVQVRIPCFCQVLGTFDMLSMPPATTPSLILNWILWVASMDAFISIDLSLVVGTDESAPRKLPTGVRVTPTILTYLSMKKTLRKLEMKIYKKLQYNTQRIFPRDP
ncbi:hypothetical protein OIU79_031214 [Salix purpurea]|uniref:Uncharacterized protein n=1 Tax=Salix purpurea TaxID=77065 RepID=A0A9Q0VB50_SALPP|nr:hypothetical protein OIU79_031214 [Salix purpurea]